LAWVYQPLQSITATRKTDVFRDVSLDVAWGDVPHLKDMIWGFKNDCEAWIESVINQTVRKDAIAAIINIIKCCHTLAVFWTILYDRPNPFGTQLKGNTTSER